MAIRVITVIIVIGTISHYAENLLLPVNGLSNLREVFISFVRPPRFRRPILILQVYWYNKVNFEIIHGEMQERLNWQTWKVCVR